MKIQEQYKRIFNQFDTNGDGKICPEELQRCVRSMGGDLTAEDAEAAIVLMDSDGDGLLCLDDFVSIVEGACMEEKARDLKEAFKMYEMAGSGYITPFSLKKMLSRLGEKRTEEDCKDMIDHFDINSDGVLNFDEFKVMMMM